MPRKNITEDEALVIERLMVMAWGEAGASPAVAPERARIAEWLQQTLDEGWLPFGAPLAAAVLASPASQEGP